jgi:hypothetical protein
MKTKLFAGLFLLSLFSALTLPSAHAASAAPAPTDLGTITVARVRGDVSVLDNATKLRSVLHDNMKVSQGSTVSTAKDSSVVLIFSNGASISLATDSSLDIQQFTMDPFSGKLDPAQEPTRSATKLNLTHGELVGKVAKLHTDQGSSFTVSTPVGAAGIRGTVFRIIYRPDGNGKAFFKMTTLEGNVEVTLGGKGTVNTPVSVTDNKEVTVDVTVTTDPVTGNTTATATLPTGQTVTVTQAPASSTAPIQTVTQQLAQAVIDAILAPPAPAPQPTTPPPKTTTGDGS